MAFNSGKFAMIAGGAGLALYLANSSREGFKNEDFKEGYWAGFFTPGPLGILFIAGVIYQVT